MPLWQWISDDGAVTFGYRSLDSAGYERRSRRGPGRCVEFAVVVQVEELDLVDLFGRLGSVHRIGRLVPLDRIDRQRQLALLDRLLGQYRIDPVGRVEVVAPVMASQPRTDDQRLDLVGAVRAVGANRVLAADPRMVIHRVRQGGQP